MIGHNWGSEHAERWVWLEGTGFEDSPGTYFDAGAARVKLGPWTDALDPLGDARCSTARRTASAASARSAPPRSSRDADAPASSSCRARTSSSAAASRAPKKDFVGWVYADPKGPEHNTLNCSVADLELTVERPGPPPRRADPAAAAPPTSSACARPTTASRSSPIPTADGARLVAASAPPTTFWKRHPGAVAAERRPRAVRRSPWSTPPVPMSLARSTIAARRRVFVITDLLQLARRGSRRAGADLRAAEFAASSRAAGSSRRRGRGRRPGRGSGGPKKTFWMLSVWPPEQAEK